MIATLLSIAGYLLYTIYMTVLPCLVFEAISPSAPSFEDHLFGCSMGILLTLALKNFPWLAPISEFPFSLPSSLFEMIATLVGLAGYLACMTGLSALVLFTAFIACRAASHPVPEKEKAPDWMLMICSGAGAVAMDMFINHSSHSTMMAILFFLAGYLVYIVCMTGLPYLVFSGAMSAFSLQKDTDDEVIPTGIAILLTLALKNFQWLALFSEFPFSFPPSVFEMIATLVGLAGYLACMMGLSLLVAVSAFIAWEKATGLILEKQTPRDWTIVIGLGASAMVMDVFINHSSHSTMMAILFFLAGYLVYIVCMTGLPYLVFCGAMSTFSLQKHTDDEVIPIWIAILLTLALKNFQWLSEFPFSFPSSVFEMIATLVGVAGYLACMMGLSLLVVGIAFIAWEKASSRPLPSKETPPDWMFVISLGASTVSMDVFINHSSHSIMMAILFFLAGNLVYIVCMTGLPYIVWKAMSGAFPSLPEDLVPFTLPISIFLPLALKNFPWLALISEFPFNIPSGVFEMVATLVGIAAYLVCMMGLSFMVFFLTIYVWEAALRQVPKKETPPDWIFMIGLGTSAVLMDIFINHSSHSTMMAILLFLASYLVYIVCMTGLPYLVFLATTHAFPSLPFLSISWIAIFLPLVLKFFPWLALISEFHSTLPSGIFEMVAPIVGLSGYLVCMTGLLFIVYFITSLVCQAASCPVPEEERPPDWIVAIVLGTTAVVMDMYINHSSFPIIMVLIFFVVGYLIRTMCMTGLQYSIFNTMSAFPVERHLRALVGSIAIFVSFGLTNFRSLVPSSLPSNISEMVAMILHMAEWINNYHTAYMVISGLAVFLYVQITRNISDVH